jgi:hypothetical protein
VLQCTRLIEFNLGSVDCDIQVEPVLSLGLADCMGVASIHEEGQWDGELWFVRVESSFWRAGLEWCCRFEQNCALDGVEGGSSQRRSGRGPRFWPAGGPWPLVGHSGGSDTGGSEQGGGSWDGGRSSLL